MADIIAMFSRWTKSGLSALLDLSGRGRQPSSLDGSSSSSSSSSSSVEATRRSALDDFQRIIRMLPRIEVVLQDAEEREIQDRSVMLWLSELRRLAYDIDDVFDEYEYDVITAQMEARAAAEESYNRGKGKERDDKLHDEVEKREGCNTLTSSSSQVPAIFDGMAEKLREIQERFDEIERDRKALHLREEDGVRRNVSAHNPRLTSSLIDESSIIGRESEKEEIVKLLLSNLDSDKIMIVPIVGMGGVGKTTLAQLIYNDPRIHQYFDLRKWIYVSEDFDLVKLTKEIYTSITNKPCEEGFGFDYLQDSIQKELSKFKRILLVLDDVWNENRCLWESLKAPFHGAGTVNILLTTRNEKVGDVMRTMNFFRLGFLSKDEGWRLFKQCASCDDKNLKEIGKKIVKKCGGLPLAIKLLGSHLRFERDEDEWLSILESELWDMDPGKNEILPALKLSYQRMPIHLKSCFRYCSIFPKNRIPEKNQLVWLWMAQGYIQPKIRGKTMEEIGRECFDELLGRSLLHAMEFQRYFKMHDLVYDLAISISDNEFFIMKLEGDNQNNCISNNVRHLAIHDQSTNNKALKDTLVHPFLTRHVALRSLFYYGNSIIDDFQLSNSICLRAVHIDIFESNSHLTKLLGSIASLKHLRYISIQIRIKHSKNYPPSKNVDLSSLFNLLHSIRNMQVLDLSGCAESIMLPTSIKNLINLRHLVLPYGSIMPCGISKLTSLQTLKYVKIKDGNHEGGGLDEIKDLANLTGSCCIDSINYAHNVEDFKKANIDRKSHIWSLCIDWRKTSDYFRFCSSDVHIDFATTNKVEKHSSKLAKSILKALRPHNNLKELKICHYPGIQFPLWLGDPSYSKLQDITLQGCNKWEGSCKVLDRDLPCLRSISIIDCAKLKNIKILQSSSLSRLLIKRCHKITTLHGLCSLHRLERLEIIKCHNLLISAEEVLPSKLQFVWFEDCWELTSITGLQNLHSLKELKLKRCPKFKLTLEEQLSSLPSVLEIIGCPGLEEWCQRYGFKNIQEIFKIEKLTIKDASHIISNYGSANNVLHILEFNERIFTKVESIMCNLRTFCALKLLKIWCCKAMTCLPGLENIESLEKLEIIDCPQLVLSSDNSLPSNLQFLLISNCPNILCLPGLEQLLSLRNLKLFECSELMLPPPEKLPFMLHVQLELFNSPKLIDWCQRYNIHYNDKSQESPNDLFVWNDQQINFWLKKLDTYFENICVFNYNMFLLLTHKWHAFRIVGFYICSCVHLKCIYFKKNFTSLKHLRIWDCSHLKVLIGLYRVTTLQGMDISNCPNLCSLCIPKSLKYLAIDRCNKLWAVNCQELNVSSLEISSCSTLIYLRGLQNQASLHFLKIYNCPRLCLDDELLPDTLNPNNAKISACPQLQEWCQEQDVAYI